MSLALPPACACLPHSLQRGVRSWGPRAAVSMKEGPTEKGQGKGTFLDYLVPSPLSPKGSFPPALLYLLPEGSFLQTSGDALVWRADAFYGFTHAQGRALGLEVPGTSVGLTASPQGKARAWRQHSLVSANLPSPQCPRITPQADPDTLHISLCSAHHFQD